MVGKEGSIGRKGRKVGWKRRIKERKECKVVKKERIVGKEVRKGKKRGGGGGGGEEDGRDEGKEGGNQRHNGKEGMKPMIVAFAIFLLNGRVHKYPPRVVTNAVMRVIDEKVCILVPASIGSLCHHCQIQLLFF
jgi:hypothetical protein